MFDETIDTEVSVRELAVITACTIAIVGAPWAAFKVLAIVANRKLKQNPIAREAAWQKHLNSLPLQTQS